MWLLNNADKKEKNQSRENYKRLINQCDYKSFFMFDSYINL
jgi:hypothetical protein